MLINAPVVARRRAAAEDRRNACSTSMAAANARTHPTRAAGCSAPLKGLKSASSPRPAVRIASAAILTRGVVVSVSATLGMKEDRIRHPFGRLEQDATATSAQVAFQIDSTASTL